ncbi:hypothetical protein [Nocardia sp. NPDC048505]|uniref:hypothetical protein n=1 Tax=unclassified Nocardia TaxID=2637762 RepID=UPI0033DEB1F7
MTQLNQPPSVAVVNRAADRLAIWHVDVGPGRGLSRLAGAWVLDQGAAEIRTLLDGRRIIDCVGEVPLPEGVSILDRLDIEAMVAAVRSEIDAADALFSEYLAKSPKSKHLVRPNWPMVVYPAKAPALSEQAPPVAAPALGTAHGLRDLAVAWFAFETLRVARDYLGEASGTAIRPLPLIAREITT